MSALRAFEMRDGMAIALTVRPRVPKRGELVRFFIQVGPPEKGGMIPDAKAALRLRDGIAYVYRMDRSAPPEPELRRLHETEEAGTYGFSKLIDAEGEYRVFYAVTYSDGRTIRVGVDCVTADAMPKEDHQAAPAIAAPPPPAPPHHEPGHGPLAMAEQHETMKVMGRHWLALDAVLDKQWDDGTRAEALNHVDRILHWSKNMPAFQLHKFQDRKAEFDALSMEMRSMITGLRDVTKDARDAAVVRRAYRNVDAVSCTKCHLKFRWGAASDLSRFPDLSGQP